jgi:hypothetical protein
MRFVSGKLFTGPSFFLTNALNDVLISQVPKSEQELLQYQKSIEKPCKDFESKLVILGLQNSDVTDNTHAGDEISREEYDEVLFSGDVIECFVLGYEMIGCCSYFINFHSFMTHTHTHTDTHLFLHGDKWTGRSSLRVHQK